MKVKLGMIVQGQYGEGVVVAMSKDWCIYQNEHGIEYAELWHDVTLDHDGPDKIASKVKAVEI